ncbi:MAG: hypothetical protein Fur0022_38290 [Anaerolineales bacterium]
MNPILTQLGHLGVIPVVVLDNAAHAIPLGEALLIGGLPCAEITFRTDAAEESIRAMSTAFPDMLVGAGTVLTVAQAETAVAAGAKFIVTPGFDAHVVDWCLSHSIPITPGVMTPTEINMALNKGLNILKFFPAEAAGGVKTLKAIAAPYGGVKFIPTGGVTPANLPEYLKLPSVHACGGSWLVEKRWIVMGEFEMIRELAAEAVKMVVEARQK